MRVPLPDGSVRELTVVSGHPAEVLNKGDQVVLADTTTHAVDGPTGKVVASARVGRTLYVATEDKLWQADLKP